MLLLLVLGFVGSACAAPEAAGSYTGLAYTAGVELFAGLQFADHPVGDLRFAPAQQAPLATEPYDATEYGDACIQFSGDLDESTSEACLFLNVFRPTGTTDLSDLPVAVWIHGGAHQEGSGGPDYNATALVSEGILVVTINYRLGSLGYLLLEEGGEGGMNGIVDQLTALSWVRDNIRLFGGNPDAVTIFGESAGSHSVCFLTASPLARGLFSRSILQSGSCDYGPWQPSSAAQGWATTQQVKASLGVDTLEELRALPSWQFVTAGADVSTGCSYGGSFLSRHPAEIYAEGEINSEAVMLGGNSFDGVIPFWWPIEMMPTSDTLEDYMLSLSLYSQAVGDDTPVPAIAEQYPLDRYYNGSAIAAFIQGDGDHCVICPTVALAEKISRAGVTTYMYYFSDLIPSFDVAFITGLVPDGAEDWASHASEIPYLFRSPRAPFASDGSDSLSASMVELWASFIKGGAPDAPAAADWPEYTAGEPNVLILGPSETTSVTQDFKLGDCAFWNGQAEIDQPSS